MERRRASLQKQEIMKIIICILFSVTFECVSTASILDTVADLLEPNLPTCRRDRDCKNQAELTLTQKPLPQSPTISYKLIRYAVHRIKLHLDAKAGVSFLETPPVKMRCYQRQYCLPIGSDLALKKVKDFTTARRGLYTIQLSRALLQPQFTQTLTKHQDGYCHSIQLKYQHRSKDGLAFAVYQEQSTKAVKDKVAILVFKGTTTLYEWTSVNGKASATGCQMMNRPFQNITNAGGSQCGLIHNGFQRAFLHILLPRVTEAIRPYRKLIIAGHSLGGALATLASMHIAATSSANHKILGVYLFANPLVGDHEFVQRFQTEIRKHQKGKSLDMKRFVATSGNLWDQRDLITMLPPTTSFRHVTAGYGLECIRDTPDQENGNSLKCNTRDLHRVPFYRDALQRDFERLRRPWHRPCLFW